MKATGMTKEEYYKKSKIGSMDITTVINLVCVGINVMVFVANVIVPLVLQYKH